MIATAATGDGNEMETFIYSSILSANSCDRVGFVPLIQPGRRCDTNRPPNLSTTSARFEECREWNDERNHIMMLSAVS